MFEIKRKLLTDLVRIKSEECFDGSVLIRQSNNIISDRLKVIMKNEALTNKDYELINSYLDQELDRKDVVKFADRMAEDPAIAAEVADLMKVKAMIKELPTVNPPRNYILTRAMAEEARPKPFWERLFPVFRTAAAFCALALVFTFVFPYLPISGSQKQAAPAENYASKSVDMAELFDSAEMDFAAEEEAPMALYDEKIILDEDTGYAAESYTAVMPSYGVMGGNPRIEYMMRQEQKLAESQESPAWDAENPPEGFISEETAAAKQRDLLIRLGLGAGLAGSIAGIVLLQRKKQRLQIS